MVIERVKNLPCVSVLLSLFFLIEMLCVLGILGLRLRDVMHKCRHSPSPCSQLSSTLQYWVEVSQDVASGQYLTMGMPISPPHSALQVTLLVSFLESSFDIF